MKIYSAVESKEGHEAGCNIARLFTIFRHPGINQQEGRHLVGPVAALGSQ